MASNASSAGLLNITAVLTDTGTELKFDVKSGESIGAVVALHTAIAVHDQIILSAEGDPISESQSVSQASLPLFIYSRRILNASKATTNPRKVTVRFDFEPLYHHGVIQREDIQYVNHVDYDSDLFREYIRYVTQALQIVYDNSQRQLQGLRIAMINLDKHIRAYDASIQEFADEFSEFSHQTENLGSDFEELIRRLSLVEIHQESSHRQETLLDKLSEGRLRSMLTRLQRDHQLVTEFVTQVYQQRKTIVDAYRGEAELLDEPATVSALFCFPFTPLHHLKKLCTAFRKIDSEINDIRARVNMKSISGVIGDRLSNLLNVEQFQLDMVEFIRNRLSSVSDIQTRIRHETKRLLAYNEVLSQKHLNLTNLRAIESIPEAYLAALIEIIRRHSYVDRICSIADEVERLRADEIKTRSMYMEEFGRLLPKEVFTGLDRRPPRYIISMDCICEDLPSIESLKNVELPSDFQLTDRLKQMIERCNFDELKILKLPLAIRKELVESNSEGQSFSRIGRSEESTNEGEIATISPKQCNLESFNDASLTSEIQTLRAVLLEKDKRISELENERNSLTMSTAVLYQENKALNDIVSRPHATLTDFK